MAAERAVNPPKQSPGAADSEVAEKDTDEQTLCPVMGMEIDKDVFVNYRG